MKPNQTTLPNMTLWYINGRTYSQISNQKSGRTGANSTNLGTVKRGNEREKKSVYMYVKECLMSNVYGGIYILM